MGIWTPEAQWVGPSPNQSGAMVDQRGMVLHVMQGSLAGSVAWAKNPSSGVSFHFGTRKSDGLVQQVVDTSITAWTQCNGNGRWVSVENEDYSGNPLSAAQVESIAKLYARGVREYGWPLQATDDPNGRGLGWHGMGGTAWCNHPTCPGEPIKAQRGEILARAAEILNPSTPPDQGDDEMQQMLVREGPTGPIWLCDGMWRQKVKQSWLDPGITGPITNHRAHLANLLGNLRTGPPGNGQPGQWEGTGQIFVAGETGADMDIWGVDIATVAAPNV